LNVWIASDTDNQQRVLQAIRDFAFPAALADLLHAHDAMVRMGSRRSALKCFKRISGAEFEECWPGAW
jgi:hypothetical protein